MKKKRNWASILLALLGIGMIISAFVGYAPEYVDKNEGTQVYEDLVDDVVIMPTIPDEIPDETVPEQVIHGIPIQQRNAEEAAQIYPCVEVDNKALLSENSDYIGWLYIPGTNISYPVCQTDNNQYYLMRRFDGSYGWPGTVFLARRNYTIFDVHTVIYGHNMNNGTMFYQLTKYRNEDFAKEHPVWWFVTKDGQKMLFEVFAVDIVQKDDEHIYFNFFDPDDPEPERFQDRIDYLLEKSSFDMGVDVSHTTNIMTLSTCKGGSTRYVINGSLLWTFEPTDASEEANTELADIEPTE